MKLLFFLFAVCFSFETTQLLSFSPVTSKEQGQTLPSRELFVKARGAQIFCRVFGSGDPVVVIHGGPGLTQDYLLPQMALLGEKNTVIFFDQRTCGMSTGDINSTSIRIESFIDDIESIRKAFGYEKITVLGHSWGGFLAMRYAIAYSNHVEKLILVSSAPASSEEFLLCISEGNRRMAPHQEEILIAKEACRIAENDPKVIEKYFRVSFCAYFYDPAKAAQLNFCMSGKAFVNGAKVSEILSSELSTKAFNLYPQLQKLRIPTLVIQGESDPIPPVVSEKIHESISNSQYVLIKKCGHFPYVESPSEFFQDLSDFMQQR